ncbi:MULTISPECIES: hypothetical protein [unclassified Empedobacter]|uniref:hypothetical protein n=1 Tax=unclassified Empedobacter TaxID=2643773 RepID=UPI0025B94B62|nr:MULTISPECIES: hypothetical protein [unclassified Empedobacter]
MNKQGKITVKHFLNENLKPYNIAGENYYSVYILVTANRQNTKFKSIALNEYYNKSNFNDILNSEEESDILLIKNEVNTIQIISELIIDTLGTFDTAFLSAYFNFSNEIYLFDPDIEQLTNNNIDINFYNSDKNKSGIKLDLILLEFVNNILVDGVSIYDFYNYENQIKFKELLEASNCKTDLNQTIRDINYFLFLGTFSKFYYYLLGSKKNRVLTEKYKFLFENSNSVGFLADINILERYSL